MNQGLITERFCSPQLSLRCDENGKATTLHQLDIFRLKVPKFPTSADLFYRATPKLICAPSYHTSNLFV